MFENFPYTDMHQLNLDWIVKIAKDFLEQYTHIQQLIEDGETSLQNTTAAGNQELEEKAAALEAALDAWYNEHSEDIANELAQAVLDFANQADIKAAQTIASIPADYTTLANSVTENTDYIINDRHEKTAIKAAGVYTYKMDGLEFIQNGYMNENGVISAGPTHKVMAIRDSTITKITFPQFPSAVGICTIILKNEYDQVVTYFNFAGNTETNIISIPDVNYKTIFINWWNGGTLSPYYTEITVESYYNKTNYDSIIRNGMVTKSLRDHLGETIYIDFRHNPAMLTGFLTGQPGAAATGFSYQHILLPAKYIKKIEISSETAPGAAMVYGYVDSTATPLTLIGSATNTYWETEYPLNGLIGINYFRDSSTDYPHGATVTLFSEAEVSYQDPYNHMIRSQLNFANKTAIYCGDSITLGHIDSVHTTTETWPKLLSAVLGLSYTNVAVAGACMTPDAFSVKSVSEQVQEITTPPDFLFIAGGINDWQVGVNMDDFKNGLQDLCTYINNNMPGTTVIWVLPIAEAGWQLNNFHPVYNPQAYRNAMFQQIMKNYTFRYYIVDGMKFGFPTKFSDSSYITYAMPDKLHPSQKGYADLYVTGMLNALNH